MPVERSHNVLYPVPPRRGKLPDGVPVAACPVPPALRDAKGRFTPGNALAAVGGRARGNALKLARLLGFVDIPEGHAFHRYHRLAKEWRADHAAELAATVGGGRLGPGPSSVIATAALQLAASRYLFDLGAESGNAKLLEQASKLADASRQNILAGHELAAKEAKARQAISPVLPPWLIATPDSDEGDALGDHVGADTSDDDESSDGRSDATGDESQ